MAASPTATVVGLNGTVVTLTWTTASNAAVAQSALNQITNGLAASPPTFAETEYAGGGILPGLPNATVTGVLLAEGTSPSLHGAVQLSGQYQVGISNDTSAASVASPQGWVVGLGTTSDTVMVGGGGGAVANLGSNTKVFFSGQGATQSFQEVGLGGLNNPSATIWMDGNATVDGSAGSTTINLDTVFGALPGFASTLRLNNNGNGANTVNIATNTTSGATTANGPLSDIIVLGGNSATATTVNAGGSAGAGSVGATNQQAGLLVFATGSDAGLINGGNSNIILVGVGSSAPITLFGGTGKDVSAGTAGDINAGSAGGSELFGSFTNATTLVGGGAGDVLATLNKGEVAIAGPGNETLASFLGGASLEGFTGAGAAGTSMIGEVNGNTFMIGNGASTVQANGFGGNTYQEQVASGSNTATITGFNASNDTISTIQPGSSTKYVTVSGTTAGAGQIAVSTAGTDTTLAFGDGTKWTLINAVPTNFG